VSVDSLSEGEGSYDYYYSLHLISTLLMANYGLGCKMERNDIRFSIPYLAVIVTTWTNDTMNCTSILFLSYSYPENGD
jgi:hypothetical protein